MSKLIQREQLARSYQTGSQVATGFTTTSGTTNDITTVLTSLSTADNVPLQVAVKTVGSESMGYVLNEAISVWDSVSKEAITDGAGNEVYAKITKPASNYLLAYFSVISGVETAYTMPAGLTLDFAPHYFYNDLKLPSDILVRVSSVRVGEDPRLTNKPYGEVLTVTATNTISNLTKAPIANTPVKLIVNGAVYTLASGAFTLAGQAITWVFNATAGGFDILTTYTVEAEYSVNS